MLYFFLALNRVFSQDTLWINIDTSFCSGASQISGEFGFYGTTSDRNGRLKDTLIKPLHFIDRQEIVLTNDYYLTNFRLVYSPTDSLFSKVEASLSYFYFDNNEFILDCYFFRKSISHLDEMNNGDTLLYIMEYKGPLVGMASAPRSEIRIIKTKDNFSYSRNNLPTGLSTYMGMDFQKGYSQLRELTTKELEIIRNYEKEVVKSVAYSLFLGSYETKIISKGKVYRFLLDNYTTNDALTMWEKLK